MRRYSHRLLHALLCLLSSLAVNAESSASVRVEAPTKGQPRSSQLSEEDEAWIRTTSLKTKVGQLFIFGFMGHDLDRGLGDTLKKHQPGSLIVFGRNIKSARQVIELNQAAQKIAMSVSRMPLLIAVDQEGGSVVRIRTSPPLPSALALGESGDPELVKSAGFHTGRLLKALGFNMNLAPVLDVADPERDVFVGTRSFSKDPETVSLMGARFASGLHESGVLPTAKHFPGHGGVADSHKQTPVNNATPERLTKIDLAPFYEGLKTNPSSAVMLAHIAYPKLDPSGSPATFSKVIVTELLRKRMGFDGLVVTDDVEMAGAFAIKDPAERAVRAIEAGADLVMVAWNRELQRSAVAAVLKAVKSGRITEARLNESLRRVIRAKRNFADPEIPETPDEATLQAVLRSEQLKSLTLETLKRQFEGSLGRSTIREVLKDHTRPIFVFSTTEGFYKSFTGGLKERTARFYQLGAHKGFNINRIMRSNPDAIGILHISGRQTAHVANQIDSDNATRMILVNSETKSLLKAPKEFMYIFDIHFKHPDLGLLTAKYAFQTEPNLNARVPAANDEESDPAEEKSQDRARSDKND